MYTLQIKIIYLRIIHSESIQQIHIAPNKAIGGVVREPKTKQDLRMNENIRKNESHELGQTNLVHMLQIDGYDMTLECPVKIDRGMQHIQEA